MQNLKDKLIKITQVTFVETEHKYFLDIGDGLCRELSGVTSLLGRQGRSTNYSGIDAEVLRKASERGTIIHNDVQAGEIFGNYSTKEGKNFGVLKAKESFEVLATEYLVSDLEYIATMIDLVIYKDGKVILADIKTTAKLNSEYVSWQQSICKYLFEKQTGIVVDEIWAVWLRGDICEIHKLDIISEADCKGIIDADFRGDIYKTAKEQVADMLELNNDKLTLLSNLENEIISLKTVISQLEERKNIVTTVIKEEMIKSGSKKYENDNLIITLVDSKGRETFDSKQFKVDEPELYKKYVKQGTPTSSVRIKIKD